MSYATVAQFRSILTQVSAGQDKDDLLQQCLDDAYSMINLELGFTFAGYGNPATAKDLQCPGTSRYLEIPGHKAASVTVVSELSSYGTSSSAATELTDWTELEDGRLYRGNGWYKDRWYQVTAEWGYGTAPDALIRVELEIAVNLWGSQGSKQISDVVGVEGGGAVGYNRALTNRQRRIIELVRMDALGVVAL